MILGAFRSCDLGADVLVSAVSVSAVEVGVHFGHESPHALTAVVAGYVVVQIFPHALDAVVIGAVRRQEVQTYSAACRRQCQSRALAVVDLEIVQHHVNALGPRISDEDLAEFDSTLNEPVRLARPA